MSTAEIRFSDRLRALPEYPLADVPAVKRRLLDAGVDVIDLGAGDNDTPPPAPTVDAMVDALGNPALSKYGFQQGLPRFRRAAADWLERRFGTRFDPATELVPLIGSKEGLAHLPLALVNPGDVAIVPEPGYQAYLGGSMLAGAEPYIAPLRAEHDFLLRFDRIPEPVLRRAKIAFVNYPNNPTAAVASREYLEEVVTVCRKYGIVLAYDNAYCELTFDQYRAPSIFEIPGAREVALEFFSLSKSYSMTGWRLGFAAGRPELVGALTRIKTYVDTGPFLAVQQAGAVALERSEELVLPVRAELTRRRDAGVAALREAGFKADVPKAAMYLWIPLPAGVPSARFAREALEHQGVVILPGSAFGPAGEGFFRIALTVGADRLRAAAERLGAVLSSTAREAGALAAAP
jgi:LL-diaminopimelate aminotransferase